MPLDRAASVCVDNSRIYSATPLSHGASVLVGSKLLFQFIDPMTQQVSCTFLFKCSVIFNMMNNIVVTDYEQQSYT